MDAGICAAFADFAGVAFLYFAATFAWLGSELRLALEYKEANLSEGISLTDISSACAASFSSVARGFKAALGAFTLSTDAQPADCVGTAPDVRRD
jgi:hypothetical protein